MTRIETSTAEAPPAVGPYSQAARIGGIVAVTGQIGSDPATGALVSNDAGAQTTQALRNVAAVLTASGCSLDDVVRVDVFLSTMDDFDAMNQAYEQAFTAPYPARATVAASLTAGLKVEFVALAVAPSPM